MRRIGLLGEELGSSAEYHRVVNEAVRDLLAGGRSTVKLGTNRCPLGQPPSTMVGAACHEDAA
jgi:hypothetical protein